MALHVFDGDRYWPADDMADAMRIAPEAIDHLRDWRDPDWPGGVEEVAIYDAPADADDPCEDGRCVRIAAPVDAGPAPEGYGFERWTD